MRKPLLFGLAIAGGVALRLLADPQPNTKEGESVKPTSPRFERLVRTDAEWKALLTPEQFEVARRQGTERPFCGIFHDHHAKGGYACVCCGLPLFASDAKFDSGTGWPSFFRSVDKDFVVTREDASRGRSRTEIVCARCEAHLGHVFEDGPQPTGLRYCLNSVSLVFIEEGTEPKPRKAVFAGGCFWGVEDRLRRVGGVLDAVSGYIGGETENPTYKEVCRGDTGHAEAVEVTFDPRRVDYARLLEVFFSIHDPTTLNRQGLDRGSQYRSAVFWTDEAQRRAAEAHVEKLKKDGKRVVTEVAKAGTFWRAEEYHQRYHERHGGACAAP